MEGLDYLFEGLQGGLEGGGTGATAGSKLGGLFGPKGEKVGAGVGAGLGALAGIGVSLYNAPAAGRLKKRQEQLDRLSLRGAERRERLEALSESRLLEDEKNRLRMERRQQLFNQGVAKMLAARFVGGGNG